MNISNQNSSKIPLAVEVDGNVVTDLNIVMEKWRNDFSHLFSNHDSPNFDSDHLDFIEERLRDIDTVRNVLPQNHDHIHHSLNTPLTNKEVEDAVMGLKNHKATGPDGIPAECLKNKTVIALLFKIYSFCFENGVIPESWLQGIINPIYKAGSVNDPLNYRGITLINVIGKCYSIILNKRLCKWLDENNVLNDEQNGFRRARSCLDHMYVLYTVTKNRILLKRCTFACFIDAKKAFDRVPHNCLWYKLHNIGIQGKIMSAIKAMYNAEILSCSVRVNEFITDKFPIKSGVKQGDPMSPTLFSIYVNDLISEINNANMGVKCGNTMLSCLFYADDIVMLSESPQGLQAQLDILNSWCRKWRMEINQDKTKIVHFRPKSIHGFECEQKI